MPELEGVSSWFAHNLTVLRVEAALKGRSLTCDRKIAIKKQRDSEHPVLAMARSTTDKRSALRS
jgi:hypothetical protein